MREAGAPPETQRPEEASLVCWSSWNGFLQIGSNGLVGVSAFWCHSCHLHPNLILPTSRIVLETGERQDDQPRPRSVWCAEDPPGEPGKGVGLGQEELNGVPGEQQVNLKAPF